MSIGESDEDVAHLQEEEEYPVAPEKASGVEDGVETDAGEEDHELHVDVDRHEQTDLLTVSQTAKKALDNNLVQESQVIVPSLVETDLLGQVIREVETTDYRENQKTGSR